MQIVLAMWGGRMTVSQVSIWWAIGVISIHGIKMHDLQWNQSIDNGRSPTYRYDENNLSLDVRQPILVQLAFLEEEKLGSNGQVLVQNDLFTIQIQREGPVITPIVLRSILLILQSFPHPKTQLLHKNYPSLFLKYESKKPPSAIS